jgi:hypothetical protein
MEQPVLLPEWFDVGTSVRAFSLELHVGIYARSVHAHIPTVDAYLLSPEWD